MELRVDFSDDDDDGCDGDIAADDDDIVDVVDGDDEDVVAEVDDVDDDDVGLGVDVGVGGCVPADKNKITFYTTSLSTYFNLLRSNVTA